MAKLRLEIVTPVGRAFSGDVNSVVIPAAEGEMGILPMHVPVLTALSPGELRIGNDSREERLVVGNGFAEITQDHVTILTDMRRAALCSCAPEGAKNSVPAAALRFAPLWRGQSGDASHTLRLWDALPHDPRKRR